MSQQVHVFWWAETSGTRPTPIDNLDPTSVRGKIALTALTVLPVPPSIMGTHLSADGPLTSSQWLTGRR
jgi:hypothetical protein